MSDSALERDAHPPAHRAVASRRVAANTVLNAAGSALPLVAAYFAMPALARGLGIDRFGVLTLGWAVLGYLTLFDLGLGRTVTKIVADGIATRREHDLAPTVWTAVWVLFAFGLALGGLAALAAPALATRALHDTPALRGEALTAFYVLAAAAPVLLVGAAMRGVLEGAQRFDLVNAVRVPAGLFTFLGPVLILPFTTSVSVVMLALLAGRVAGALVQLVLAVRVLPALSERAWPARRAAGPLLRAGAWMSAGNVLAPLMMTADRFLMAGTLSIAAVGFYTAPYEIVTKLWLVPGAVSAALFPAFAGALADGRGMRDLFSRGVTATFVILVPPAVVLLAFAREGLDGWMGHDFALHGTWVVRWLAVGIVVNSVAQIPHALLQSAGRAPAVAKLHALELPAYLGALVLLMREYGVAGAAFAWTARAVVDAAGLFWLSLPVAPLGEARTRRLAGLGGAAAAAALLATALPLAARLVFVSLVIALFLAAAWRFALRLDERAALARLTRRIGAPGVQGAL